MSCLIKNIPPDFMIASGNRGTGFPYNQCDLPAEEICYLAVDDENNNNDEIKIELDQENGEPVVLRCIG